MYNCWNEALAYLIKTYGGKTIQICSQNNKTAQTFNEENIKDSDGKHIALLMKQYYYGISAKKELYYKLIDMNVITEVVTN